LDRAIEYLTKATGKRPVGYRAPSWAFSASTLDLIQKKGFLYDRRDAVRADAASASERTPRADAASRRVRDLHEIETRGVVRDRRTDRRVFEVAALSIARRRYEDSSSRVASVE
jgi:peptidoglycan/xylan/chitin deacetylase (PgdA/CDA1 family)